MVFLLPDIFKKMAQKNLIVSIFSNKCPRCRKGNLFVNRGIFPLGQCLKMNKTCTNCDQRLIYETNNGPGINYALTVIIFFLNILWYWPLFGISYKDDSVFYFLAASTMVILVLQPWLMRLSRSMYIYALVLSGSTD